MAQKTMNAPVEAQRRLAAWPVQVNALLDQIGKWARDEGWHVDRNFAPGTEWRFGTYEGADLVIRTPDSDVVVTPVRPALGGRVDGWVTIQSFPRFSRVRLTPLAGDRWDMVADGNIPLRRPWDAPSFVQLIKDMTA